MDGVPVKISEKYKPPKKISLPGSVLNKIKVLKETKAFDYDFSFERAVLDQVEKINTYKKSVQEKKKKALAEQVKPLEESSEKLTIVSCEDSSPSPPETVKSESESVHYEIPSSLDSNIDILAPLPVSNNALSKEKRKVDNAILSEFDSDTSSPFDNMELKSINDLKELADVLGSSNKSSVVKEDKSKPINGITIPWKNSDQRNYGYMPQYYPHGVYTGQMVPSVYSSYPPHMMSADHSYQRSYITDYKLPVVSVPNSSYQTHSPNLSPPYVSSVPPPLPPKPASLSSNPTSYSAYTSPAHTYKYSHPSSPAIPPKSYPVDVSYYQPSSSVKPDTEINRSVSSQRLDPAEVSLWTDLQSTLQNRKIVNQQQEQKSSQSQVIISSSQVSNNVSVCNDACSLPNPLMKLNHEGQSLARRMSEMGFPLSRSARAVQIFNCDEAKVIEFLLQVQNFEDRHFPGDLVENALIANNFNDDSALSYLENVKKLTDFGFSEEQVITALEKSNNNTDRALDFLIT